MSNQLLCAELYPGRDSDLIAVCGNEAGKGSIYCSRHGGPICGRISIGGGKVKKCGENPDHNGDCVFSVVVK